MDLENELTLSQMKSFLGDEAFGDQYSAEEIEEIPPLSSQSFEYCTQLLLSNSNVEVKPHIAEDNSKNSSLKSIPQPVVVKDDIQEGNNSQPILVKDEFGGNYDFQLILPPNGCGKFWIFSEKLSKIYVKPKEVLPIFIGCNYYQGLFVRAALAYKSDQHRSKPVVRCLNHIAEDSTSNKKLDAVPIKHIVRCMHPRSTYYESSSGHLSVLAPLGNPAAGASSVPLDFKFTCQNSCASGMNRRPTEIIFSLETKEKQVLGRKRFDIRICSCPKRDMDKEQNPDTDPENAKSKKRKSSNLPSDHIPKKKIADNQEYNLNIKIVGKGNYNAAVKYIYDLTAGDAARTKNYDFYQPYLDDTEKLYLSQ